MTKIISFIFFTCVSPTGFILFVYTPIHFVQRHSGIATMGPVSLPSAGSHERGFLLHPHRRPGSESRLMSAFKYSLVGRFSSWAMSGKGKGSISLHGINRGPEMPSLMALCRNTSILSALRLHRLLNPRRGIGADSVGSSEVCPRNPRTHPVGRPCEKLHVWVLHPPLPVRSPWHTPGT